MVAGTRARWLTCWVVVGVALYSTPRIHAAPAPQREMKEMMEHAAELQAQAVGELVKTEVGQMVKKETSQLTQEIHETRGEKDAAGCRCSPSPSQASRMSLTRLLAPQGPSGDGGAQTVELGPSSTTAPRSS